jgi:CheY-like chemotaxis protein
VSARLRVIVADDERPARSFLVALLRSFEDVAVIGEAASGKEAVAMIEKEKPDLAFLDWQMPELDGIGVVRILKRQNMPLVALQRRSFASRLTRRRRNSSNSSKAPRMRPS